MASRALLIVPAVALVAMGCSAAAEDVGTSTTVLATTAPAPETSTTAVLVVPPELADVDLDMVVVGDRLMLLAIADTPELRARGLMGVTEFGDVEGMLFFWRHAAEGGFWMKDTPVPLDIVWFDQAGAFVGRASMEPCTQDPCTIYSPGDDVDYRYAIEAPPGALDWIDDATVIVYGD